ncbi:MAG: site-specific DNA-methyltransferase, partial [Gemmatimonadota bacterium]|nr:site-specific DNA-methyltransferase [Gemmatimonadota bacterium]
MCYMAVRLLEIKRVLKDTGSLYLHCDHTAGAYLRQLLDAVFSRQNFRSAIAWERNDGRGKGSQHAPKTWGVQTDTILYYAKSDRAALNPNIAINSDDAERDFPRVDAAGRRYKTGIPVFCSKSMGARPNLCFEWRGYANPHPSGWRLSKERLEEEYQRGNVVIRADGKLERRKYLDEYAGKPVGDLWLEIPATKGIERTGYPTQKPVALAERIIKASCPEDGVVLDCFAGCAYVAIAAERLGRNWVACDINARAWTVFKRQFSKPKLATLTCTEPMHNLQPAMIANTVTVHG